MVGAEGNRTLIRFLRAANNLPAAYLRPGNSGAAGHAWAILKLLVQRLRQASPQVKIMFRGDSGFCRWWANQFRLLPWSFAHVLLERLRAVGLTGTELARAQAGTLRLKLLKIGAVALRNTRRIQLLLSSSYPRQRLFGQVAQASGSG